MLGVVSTISLRTAPTPAPLASFLAAHAAVGFDLSRKGWKTLNVDKLSGAGYGSTAVSCAIIRVHYSTLDGCAMAYEGYHYWKDWSNYLDSEDERGHALYIQSGTVLFMLEGGHHEKVLPLFDEVQVPKRFLPTEDLPNPSPFTDNAPNGEPSPPKATRSRPKPRAELIEALTTQDSGKVTDPRLPRCPLSPSPATRLTSSTSPTWTGTRLPMGGHIGGYLSTLT